MYKHEILRNEQEFVSNLSEKESAIYLFDEATEQKLAAINDFQVSEFLGIARVLNELHELHESYNAGLDFVYALPNETPEQQKTYDLADKLLEAQLRMTIAIGEQATTVDLTCMDMCDTIYRMLSDLKMLAFDNIYNYSTAVEQLEKI